MAVGSLWILVYETLLTACNFRVGRCCGYRGRSLSYWICEENSNGMLEKKCVMRRLIMCIEREILQGCSYEGSLDGLDLLRSYTLKKCMQNLVEKHSCKNWILTNLMRNFIYSIIILHHDPLHVSSITMLIFRRTIVYLQYLVSSHSVWQHTEREDTGYCKHTIVLLKMSTVMLETCRGSWYNIIIIE
jgi:hypothetical protein